MWIFFALAGASHSARAHPEYNPTHSNRYLKLSLEGGGVVRVAWSLMVGEAPAMAVRKKADVNGDGVVDEAELKGFADDVAHQVSSALAIDVDGSRRAVEWEPPIVGLSDRRVTPVPFSIDLVGKLPVKGAGTHLLKVDDESTFEGMGESEIRIEEGPGTRLLAAWKGREDGGRQTRFVWSGPRYSVLEDRSIGFRFVDERARGGGRVRAPVAIGGALLAAAVAALITLRRGRAQSRRRK